MNIFHPHPTLTLFHRFSFATHGLLFALGAEAGLWILYFLAEKRQLKTENLSLIVVAIAGAGLIASRVGFIILYFHQFHSVLQALAIWQGGLVSYFGITAGLMVAIWLFGREDPGKTLEWLDALAIATLVAWAIGRLGNYWAVDSIGVGSLYWPATYYRVPIQLFESAWCLLVALWCLRQWHKQQRAGTILFQALVGYFAGRAIIDTWRDEASIGGLHYSQWASLFFLLLVVGYWHHFYAKKSA